jgi:RNA polymerase sigma factor (sigma-70 family)
MIVRTDVKLTSQSVVQIEPVIRTANDDHALVARARAGDRDAFARLIEARALRLLRTATVILGNEADAHESAQEALIAAWVHLPRLRDADRFDAWLTRTLVNKCRDAVRKRRRVREIDLGLVEMPVSDATDAVAGHQSVLAAFDRLSVEHRHILVLHHLDDLSIAEIAHQLEIPVGTAKSRLWTARRALEQALEAES